MKTLATCAMLCALAIAGCVSQSRTTPAGPDRVETAVRAMLDTQIADWNAGDIDGFMRSYWADPDVRFASAGDVKRGWQRVLEQYRKRYPDKASMGALTTRELQVTALSEDSAIAFGRWIVTAGDSDYCGLFTLVIRRIESRWVIVHDLTSSAAGPTTDGRSCADIKAAS